MSGSWRSNSSTSASVKEWCWTTRVRGDASNRGGETSLKLRFLRCLDGVLHWLAFAPPSGVATGLKAEVSGEPRNSLLSEHSSPLPISIPLTLPEPEVVRLLSSVAFPFPFSPGGSSHVWAEMPETKASMQCCPA